jgi:FkbM family methyltransferase
MNFYGQNLEDKIVWDFFKETYGQDFKGAVLDLGANDGVFLSNSRVFIENGWRGFLVEAGKEPFKRLFDLYKGESKVQIINYAISTENGVATFYESGSLISETDCGLVSSIIPNETERWRKAGTRFTSYQVECKTFETLFGKGNINLIEDNIQFDFISIDIEGMDYDILKQIDLRKYGCKCLCVEFNGVDKQKYIDYVSSYGMVLIHENPENLIFVNK